MNYLERMGIIKIVDDLESNLRFIGFSLEAYRDSDHLVYKHQVNKKNTYEGYGTDAREYNGYFQRF